MLMTEEGDSRKIGPLRIPRRIQRISWRDLAASLGPVLLVSVVAIWIASTSCVPRRPDTIIITSGSEGSIDRTTAEKYRKILVRNGVKLEILPSQGSLENLNGLRTRSSTWTSVSSRADYPTWWTPAASSRSAVCSTKP